MFVGIATDPVLFGEKEEEDMAWRWRIRDWCIGFAVLVLDRRCDLLIWRRGVSLRFIYRELRYSSQRALPSIVSENARDLSVVKESLLLTYNAGCIMISDQKLR